MSGKRAQAVVELELNRLFGDPREQIRRATGDLPPDTNVRVVCNLPPVPLGFPIVTHLDTAWYRIDLNWQFLSAVNHWEWASEWTAIANYLGGAR